ncbi:MAG TPA: hypothetical protein VMP01_07985 [Pirellulaceae bacterium]|nr:hypothetical protein [Pirellulaceae bacterium]
MNRTERDFRRSLTRRVRAIVDASPEMRAEWQRRRLSLRRLIIIGGAVAFCALFAILAVPFGIGHGCCIRTLLACLVPAREC